jgi:metallo-beta-lactamase family protein
MAGHLSLRFLGGAGTVTGSRFLVDGDAGRVLVDIGMFQGLRDLRRMNWQPFPVDPRSIDAIVLTHAHLDHVGFLPVLAREGFRGPVIATPTTVELAKIVLADSARLHEEDADYANKRGFSKHHPALALYTVDDAAAASALLHPTSFDATFELPGGCGVLRPAGHILGSATAEVSMDGVRILVTGDLGRPTHPLLAPPAPRPTTDIVVTESTYGDRVHEPVERAMARMAEAITRTVERGGTVIVPAFAVDRTEVMLLALYRLRAEGRIPDVPVHVDSPMALDVLGVYRMAVAARDTDIRPDADIDGLSDHRWLHQVRTPSQSKELNNARYPSIIVSASGMATGGRVLHHLEARLPRSRDTVLLCGFQAEGTRGRSLADGERTLRMHGHDVPVRAEILMIDAFSVHADADELVAWHGGTDAPRAAYAVHGEPAAAAALAKRLDVELGWQVSAPQLGDVVNL